MLKIFKPIGKEYESNQSAESLFKAIQSEVGPPPRMFSFGGGKQFVGKFFPDVGRFSMWNNKNLLNRRNVLIEAKGTVTRTNRGSKLEVRIGLSVLAIFLLIAMMVAITVVIIGLSVSSHTDPNSEFASSLPIVIVAFSVSGVAVFVVFWKLFTRDAGLLESYLDRKAKAY